MTSGVDLDAILNADPGSEPGPPPDAGEQGVEGNPNGTGPPDIEGRPFARPLKEFIAARDDTPAPLIGTPDDCVLPAYGLLLLIAKGGKGKTTATLDAVLHFASGLPWFGFETARPLRILFIENEGPREPFRRKLERRCDHWPHPLTGGVYIYDQGWGEARLNERAFVDRLNRFVDEQRIDLVVGDPLDTLGMDGVGSPEDTRAMVARFQEAGLFSRVAWWVLHHARKEKTEDAIDEASGAWAGKPDALLGLEKLTGNRARLGFHKLRWGRRDGFTYLLGYDPEAEALELLGEDGDEERDYAAEIEELLRSGGEWKGSRWPTWREIAAKEKQGGIGANKDIVREVLEANPQRFISRTGDAAKEVGRSSRATVWQLAQGSEPVEPVGGSQGDLATGLDSGSALKGQSQSEPVPHDSEEVAPAPEPVGGRSRCPSHPEPVESCRYCQAATEGAR